MKLRILVITGLILVLLTVITIPVSAYEYSMTSVSVYNNPPPGSALPYANEIHNNVQSWLTGAGWTQRFYEFNPYVEDTDFGSQNSGYQGLDEADLHYHFGHGINVNGETRVEYQDYPNSYLERGEVYKKWDLTNKWVVLDACEVLANLQWGSALKTSHGILGFSTEKTPDPNLPDRFFRELITYDDTIGYSWKRATLDTYGGSVTARVVFDTQNQLLYDHLSGQGTVQPNENPDDNTIYYDEWTC